MISIEALKSTLPPLACDAVETAVELGCAACPLELYRWAEAKTTDLRQPDDRRHAAALIMRRLAEAALEGGTWGAL